MRAMSSCCKTCASTKARRKTNLELGKAYAALCDVFVNDAFGTAHRAQASTEAVAPSRARCLRRRIDGGRTRRFGQSPETARASDGGDCRRQQSVHQTDHPRIAGGQSRPTHRRRRHRQYLPLAEGKAIGKSLAEHDLVEESKKIMAKMAAKGGSVPLRPMSSLPKPLPPMPKRS